MSLAITIEIGDADLKHFIDAMRRSQVEAEHLSPSEVTRRRPNCSRKVITSSCRISSPSDSASSTA
jgi:hypothetical protein